MVFRKLIIQKSSLAILWRHLTKRRQKQFSLLLILMIMASLAEIISIGAVLPFLGILTALEQVYQHSLMQLVIQILALTEPKQLILPLTILFITTVLLAGVIRLSGGQRQRIGIARALYKQANVLIFDEATSALDNETEQAVMDAIKDLGEEVMILIIAHRLTTLIGCDEIIKLEKEFNIKTGTYEDIVGY